MNKRMLAAAAVWAGCLIMTPALAQNDFPNRQIRILVGFPPGGSTDVMARMIAQEGRKFFGSDMIVINRPGATSTIAISEVANSPPDGYTIGIVPSGIMTLTHLFQNTRPDLIDATHALAIAGRLRSGLAVRADSPIRNVKDMIDAARAKPGAISIGSPGAGTSISLITRTITQEQNVEAPIVPMIGDQQVAIALLGGHVSVATSSASGFAEHIRAGTMRLIASMEKDRLDISPDTGTLIEQGYNHSVTTLQYFMAPRGTPPAVRKKLIEGIRAATATPAYVEILKQHLAEDNSNLAGEELDAFLQKERERALVIATKLGVVKSDPEKK